MQGGSAFLSHQHRMWTVRGLLASLLLGLMATAVWTTSAADDPAPVPTTPSLKGILPSAIPEPVVSLLGDLPESWQPWGGEVAKDLGALYESDSGDPAFQRQVLSTLRGRVATLRKAIGDPRYAPVVALLVDLHGQLLRRVDLAEATLDTLALSPQEKMARLETTRARAAQAAANLRTYLDSIPNGAGWADYVRLRDWSVPPGGPAFAATPPTGQVAIVQTRLKEKDQLGDPQMRAFLARPQFRAYEQAVSAYLNALNSQKLEANSPELREQLANLFTAIEQFEASGSKVDSSAARAAFDAVRRTAIDGGERIAGRFREHYMNYNFRVLASEPLVSKIVGEQRSEVGAVNDFILGAKVDGSQQTWSNVSVDLVPNARAAQFNIVVNGQISSNTQGVTEQAVIYTAGNHAFRAEKPVLFDGNVFSTLPASIGVNASNTTVGAETSYSRLPLLGGLARRVAVRRSNEMRGESEAITRGKIEAQVLPRLNSEVDSKFGPQGATNVDLNNSVQKLRDLGLYPDAKSYSTTDYYALANLRLMSGMELGASTPLNSLVLPGTGCVVQMHESWLNNASDRLDLAGKTMTEEELRMHLEDRFSRLAGKKITFAPPPKSEEAAQDPLTLVFDESDPIRLRVSAGQIYLTVRAAFRQPGKDEIPAQVITVPLKFTVEGNFIIADRGDISVAAVERPANVADQVARAGVIKQRFQNALPRREVDRFFRVERDPQHIITMGVQQIVATDGWVYLLRQ